MKWYCTSHRRKRDAKYASACPLCCGFREAS